MYILQSEAANFWLQVLTDLNNIALTAANKFSVTLTNTSSVSQTISYAVGDLVISGSGSNGITVATVTATPSGALAVGAIQLIEYSLSGTPVLGDIIANWTNQSLSCSVTKAVSNGDATFTNAKNNEFVFSANDSNIGLNIQGILSIGTTLNLAYTSGVGSYDAYTSPFVSIPAAFCEDGASDWTFGYSYGSGTFSASGDIVASLITQKAGVDTAWPAFKVSDIATINFDAVTVPLVLNGNTKANTIGIDEGGDAIRGSLSTNGGVYDAAAVNDIVQVTEAEYNNISVVVPGVVKAGKQDITDGASGLGAYTWAQNGNGTTYLNLVANSYVCAYAFGATTNYTNVYMRIGSAASVTGTVTPLSNNTGGLTATGPASYQFYVVKRPTTHSGTNTIFVYSSTAQTGGRNFSSGSNAYGLSGVSAADDNIPNRPFSFSSQTPTIQYKYSTQKSW